MNSPYPGHEHFMTPSLNGHDAAMNTYWRRGGGLLTPGGRFTDAVSKSPTPRPAACIPPVGRLNPPGRRAAFPLGGRLIPAGQRVAPFRGERCPPWEAGGTTPEPTRLRRAFHEPQGRSAGLQPAVSRIFNPLAARTSHALPNAIRRYSRLQICATSWRWFMAGVQVRQAQGAFHEPSPDPQPCRAGIPAGRFWGLSSPQLGRRAGKPAEPAAWKGCPTGLLAPMRGLRTVETSPEPWRAAVGMSAARSWTLSSIP